jgi:hypothetical protein
VGHSSGLDRVNAQEERRLALTITHIFLSQSLETDPDAEIRPAPSQSHRDCSHQPGVVPTQSGLPRVGHPIQFSTPTGLCRSGPMALPQRPSGLDRIGCPFPGYPYTSGRPGLNAGIPLGFKIRHHVFVGNAQDMSPLSLHRSTVR